MDYLGKQCFMHLRDEAEWQIAYALLAGVRTTTVVVTNHHGDTVYERQTGPLNKNMIYPLKVVLSGPKEQIGRPEKYTRCHWAWR